jgi:hypothetical protein
MCACVHLRMCMYASVYVCEFEEDVTSQLLVMSVWSHRMRWTVTLLLLLLWLLLSVRC